MNEATVTGQYFWCLQFRVLNTVDKSATSHFGDQDRETKDEPSSFDG